MIAALSWLITIPVISALSIFIAEIIFGAFRLKTKKFPGLIPSTTILVPAHNEADAIKKTLTLLAPALSDKVRVLVVADNCTDDTARLVRQAGYDVVERADANRRGKGYALAFGRDYLRAAPPECVIVFDADCQSDVESIEVLAKCCVFEHAVVQASDILKPDRSASPKVQISSFAFWIKNVVRQRGAHRFGSAAVLMGTGMAFPWEVFESAPLATANIVEDLSLGLYLTRNGHPPIFLEQSRIVSAAASETATLQQRTRWEHGFLNTAKSYSILAIRDGIKGRNRKLLQLGLHLLVPPMALLLLFGFTILFILGAAIAVTEYWPAFTALAICLAAACSLVFLNWLIEGRRWLSLAAMLRIPLYIAWKVPVYLRFIKGDIAEWTRTERSKKGT